MIEKISGMGKWGAKPEWFSLSLPSVLVNLDIWKIDKYPKTGHWTCYFDVLAGWAKFPFVVSSLGDPQAFMSLDSLLTIQDWVRAHPPSSNGLLNTNIHLPLKLNFDRYTAYLHLDHATVGLRIRNDGGRLATTNLTPNQKPRGASQVADAPEATRHLRRVLKQHSKDILQVLSDPANE